MWIVGILLGGLAGAIAGESGALAGAFVGAIAGLAWTLTRREKVEARIGELERKLDVVTERLDALQQGRGAFEPARAADTQEEAAAAAGMQEAVREALPILPPPEAASTQAADIPASAPEAAVAAEGLALAAGAGPLGDAFDARPERAAAPSQPSRIWQWLTGGNPFVRVGVVVLFFGVAFLLRYAAEHVRFPIELRLAAVAAGAVGLLAIGWWLRLRRAGYALILQGAAIGVLFLTVFASFRLYGLLPAGLTFFLLIALVVFAVVGGRAPV